MSNITINEHLKISIVNIIWSFDTASKKILILLVKNSLGPEVNRWSLPATILRADENAEQGSLRLIKDKIGINLPNFYTEQLATFSDINRSIKNREVALSYMTYLPSTPKLVAGFGASDARWFSVDYADNFFTLKNGNLTFQTIKKQISDEDFYKNISQYRNEQHLSSDHELILRHAFERVTNRLNYSPTILLILGEEFTLKEAREVYATFWKEPYQKIDNSNFRKTHAPLFIEVGIEHGKSGRPAKLYKLK